MSLEMLELGNIGRNDAIDRVRDYFRSRNYKITRQDLRRPWGFFFYFDPGQTEKFAAEFFESVELTDIDTSLPLQPKVLVFEPGQQTSWQYHFRRSEIQRAITRCVLAASSHTDELGPKRVYKFGEVISSAPLVRHFVGAPEDEWGAVVEIWQHTDPRNPSNEDDIKRIQDLYGRK